MSTYDEIQEAARFLRTRSSIVPTTGVVLGSGLGAFADSVTQSTKVPYATVPHFPASTVMGHAGELVLGTLGQVPVAVMSGRVHGYEGHSAARVGFPIRVLAALGVKRIIVTNAAGSVNPTFAPGDFMLLVDHLNLTGTSPLHGPNDDRLGPRFPDMTRAYSDNGQRALHQAARETGVSLREGVYAGLPGPTYETPAEVRMLRTLGADAVGMSTVAEVITARHAGLEVAGLSIITNRGAGLSSEPLSHDEVKEVAARVRAPLCAVLARAVALFA